MIKYRYEFEAPIDFEKGCCYDCPLCYENTVYCDGHIDVCVLGVNYEDCPLQEVGDE